MKKCVLLLMTLILFCTLILPVTAFGQEYSVSGTDFTITIDDSEWYVFTRDNIKDNPDLEAMGMTYDKMYDNMVDNHIYVDAIALYDNSIYMNLVIIKRKNDEIVNLSNYDDDYISSWMKSTVKKAEEIEVNEYELYETEYKFMKLDAIQDDKYLCRYFTIVNGYEYRFDFIAMHPFSKSDYKETERIIDSTEFDIDTSLKEKGKTESGLNNVIKHGIFGLVCAIIFGEIPALISRRKKKKQAEANPENVSTPPQSTPKKKDSRSRKRRIAVILFVAQGISVLGSVLNGEIERIFDENIPFLIGFFLPAIIGVILLISANKKSEKPSEAPSNGPEF